MQKGKALLPSLLAILGVICFGYQCSAQMTPPPVPMFATNTNGFIQNGANGANNLVLFTVDFPPEPEPGGELPEHPPEPPFPFLPDYDFTVIGSLSSGNDSNGDGIDDSIGNFSGLEWSSATPGSGTLIGCVLNDDDGNGEIYRIIPETGATELIGKAPEGLVRDTTVEAGGSGYASSPFPVPTSGGSGQDLTVIVSASGSVSSVEIWNCGRGYQVNDIVTILAGDQNATIRITEVIEETGFTDLAYDPINGRMWGIMNEIESDGGDPEFLPNLMWFDSDGDLIPDRKSGNGRIAMNPLCQQGGEVMQTMANGIAFDQFGVFWVYDNVEEKVFAGSPTCVFPIDEWPTPFGPMDFGDTETTLTNSLSELGSGLAVVNGDDLVIATDAVGNETVISTFFLPDLGGGPGDPTPAVYNRAQFDQSFQNGQFAMVRVGDLVAAQTDFDNDPQAFPDNVVIINGIAGKNAVLEALAVADDFRFCVMPEVPPKGEQPLTLELVYTLPNPEDITALGVEMELHSNVPNLGQFFRAYNVNTQQFDVLDFNDAIPFGTDDTIIVDLSFLGFENYIDPNNGTFKIQIDTISLGLVPFYPWQMKYDSILAVFSFD